MHSHAGAWERVMDYAHQSVCTLFNIHSNNELYFRTFALSHYFPCKQPTLMNLIPEPHSKCVAIHLLSQSPNDFRPSGHHNFAREMDLTLIYSCVPEKLIILKAGAGGCTVEEQAHLE